MRFVWRKTAVTRLFVSWSSSHTLLFLLLLFFLGVQQQQEDQKQHDAIHPYSFGAASSLQWHPAWDRRVRTQSHRGGTVGAGPHICAATAGGSAAKAWGCVYPGRQLVSSLSQHIVCMTWPYFCAALSVLSLGKTVKATGKYKNKKKLESSIACETVVTFFFQKIFCIFLHLDKQQCQPSSQWPSSEASQRDW